MCLVAPKSAKLHDPLRIWKCSELNDTVHASDWNYTGTHLESTDGTGSAKCATAWTVISRAEIWKCETDESEWNRQGLQFIHRNTGKCLDAGSGRRNGDIVTVQPCTAGNTGQDFTRVGSKLVV